MDENKFLEHCKSLSREDRLQFVYGHVSGLYCSDSSIDFLKFLVNMEHGLEYHDNPASDSYFNNVRQTKIKQLDALLREKDKPRVRPTYWEETKQNFMTDISHELFSRYRITAGN